MNIGYVFEHGCDLVFIVEVEVEVEWIYD